MSENEFVNNCIALLIGKTNFLIVYYIVLCTFFSIYSLRIENSTFNAG